VRGVTVLVAHASARGSTREVAAAVAATLAEQGVGVEVRPAAEVESLDAYDAVVLGGSLYYGRWHRDARGFLRRHRGALASRPLAVFGMGPLTLADDEVAGSRAQLDRALAKAPHVRPASVAIFGGVVDPAKLRFPLNRMPASDARDWDAIEEWAAGLAETLAPAPTLV
jgi:menaquinone-dependent protoporphyrinogen oxidase